MKKAIRALIRTYPVTVFACALLGLLSASALASTHFKVSLDGYAAKGDQPVSGRLLIFMTKSDKPLQIVAPDFTNPNAVYISGTEISDLAPGKTIDIDADTLSFPGPFSSAPAGEYQVMLLLDRDHSYTYFNRPDGGDLLSDVQKVTMPANETSLTLSKMITVPSAEIHPNTKVIHFESPMLSAFWGRPINMDATVVLPPKYANLSSTRYPTVYMIHGYGGGYVPSKQAVDGLLAQMQKGEVPEMILVYLNAHCPMGHHVFADSVNNGPWGSALVKEFIPYLEKQFRMDAKPSGRFLTGHSSGGWSTLWVMISHPDFFGGTWSTSPDPVDFRNFTGPDFTKLPAQNAYFDAGGKEYNLVRAGNVPLMSVRQYALQERVLGYYGGQFASFEAVFSPKGPDGQPMRVIDRDTGKIEVDVANAWEKYDISRLLRDNWTTLKPKLKGKIHIVVGTADTFHLNEAVQLLDTELKKLGSDAKIEYLEGRDHFNLYQGGLRERFFKEMYAVARPNARAAAK